ncbi:methylenetetrahydrofolate reductase C-terminal domain-containing protein [Paradesulfitobacterium ferrireducens]|uniref:methylenetetrahydrofolate reductase C-terminal domain-containing protein n=1 Tax=Paradesulfitobacterium ferrireducens TaxID=2816476 RepID=UPI001A8DA78B|nr:methylenetetrahydrofolate reductase C-terminal domain-containing protein [Paradesulfitobacterium ferrireducens]
MTWPVRLACLECEECMLEHTEGICPIRLCAKSLVSGPCGGSNDSKCEVNQLASCVWSVIYSIWAKHEGSGTWPWFFKDYARAVKSI